MSEENPGGEVAFVAALAAGSSVKDAAAAAGISERTAHRRLTEPEVRREISAMRSAALEEASCQLARASRKAAEVVAGLLDHGDAKVRLQASRLVVQLARELGEEATRHATLARPSPSTFTGFYRTAEEIAEALAGGSGRELA